MKPQAAALISVCPYCHESAEIVLTKKQIKRLLHGFKLSALNRAVGIKTYCPRCKKPIEIYASRKDVKALWKGMGENSTTQAAATFEKHRHKSSQQF